MDEQETNTSYTHKLDKSIIKVLWMFAIALLLNALLNNPLINAFAEEKSAMSRTFTIILTEPNSYDHTIPSVSGIDLDD